MTYILVSSDYIDNVNTSAKQKIAQIVRDGCSRHGQRGYARLLGVSQYAVQNWLDCGSTPNVENLKKISTSAGYDFDEFIQYLELDKDQEDVKPLDEILRHIKKLPREELVQVIYEGTKILAGV